MNAAPASIFFRACRRPSSTTFSTSSVRSDLRLAMGSFSSPGGRMIVRDPPGAVKAARVYTSPMTLGHDQLNLRTKLLLTMLSLLVLSITSLFFLHLASEQRLISQLR